MGIFLHVGISKSVQKKEWESVYEETLRLCIMRKRTTYIHN